MKKPIFLFFNLSNLLLNFFPVLQSTSSCSSLFHQSTTGSEKMLSYIEELMGQRWRIVQGLNQPEGEIVRDLELWNFRTKELSFPGTKVP